MVKKILFLLFIIIMALITPSSILAAAKGAGDICDAAVDSCPTGYLCQRVDPVTSICEKAGASSVFGKIEPPKELLPFTSADPTGAGGISQFFSNFVGLFYSVAILVLILMLVWGAFDWLTSGGDKEKIAAARGKLINAVIGIILFAIAFAAIQVLGQFTGFTFFAGQR